MQQIFKHFTKRISLQLRLTRSIGFIESQHNKNRGQNSIAFLLAGNIVRDDKKGAALLRFDKVIWWRQMVESAASLVAEITLKPFFSPRNGLWIMGAKPWDCHPVDWPWTSAYGPKLIVTGLRSSEMPRIAALVIAASHNRPLLETKRKRGVWVNNAYHCKKKRWSYRNKN